MKIRNNEVKKEVFCLNQKRGYRTVITDSFWIILTYIKTWFLSVWPLCLVLGCLFTLLFNFRGYIPSLAGSILTAYVLSLMVHISHSVLESSTEREDALLFPFSYKKIRHQLSPAGTTFLTIISFALVSAVLWLLAYRFLWGHLWVYIVTSVITLVLIILCILSIYYQVVFKSSLIEAVKWSFSNIFRLFWKTLFISFFSSCMCAVLGFFLALPILILDKNIQLSNQAVALGDPTDFPDYMFWCTPILSIILLSLASVLFLLMTVPFHLQMHSIYTITKKK